MTIKLGKLSEKQQPCRSHRRMLTALVCPKYVALFRTKHPKQNGVPAHDAVGLADIAPRLVPRRGHTALIPDASVPSGLRASLAMWVVECVGEAALLFPSTYHAVLAVKGCAVLPCGWPLASWRPSATPDCCAASCFSGSGQFRPIRTGARS